MAGALAIAEVVILSNEWDHTAPSTFAPVDVKRASPGTIGCSSVPGEVCYLASFESTLQGLTLSHLRFQVANASAGTSTQGPLAPPLPLGANARVSALASPTAVAGVWSVIGATWTSGADWSVPIGPDVTVILDTGLVTDASLADAEFAIILTSPFEGALGFPLFCAQC